MPDIDINEQAERTFWLKVFAGALKPNNRIPGQMFDRSRAALDGKTRKELANRSGTSESTLVAKYGARA